MKSDASHDALRRSQWAWTLVSAAVLSLMCAIYSPVLFAWTERSGRDATSEHASFILVRFNWIMAKAPSLYIPLLRFHGWIQGYEASNKDGFVHGYAGPQYEMFFFRPVPP